MKHAQTADAVVFAGLPSSSDFSILLIQRGHPPYKHLWALPGGFIDEGEAPQAAFVRELAEETHLQINEQDSHIFPLSIRQKKGRDPRGHTVTYPFLIWLPERCQIQAGDDARAAQWVKLQEIPELAFDHGAIICEALSLFYQGLPTQNLELIKQTGFGYKLDNYEEVIFYGGTFNPWHDGHMACIKLCLEEVKGKNSKLIILPDNNPQKKNDEELLLRCSWEHYKNIQIQLLNYPQIWHYPGFIGKEEGNPTYYWLKETKELLPHTKCSLLMGDDSFKNIFSWIEVDKLLNILDSLYIAPRHLDSESLKNKITEVQTKAPQLNIIVLGDHSFRHLSSTQIRAELKKDKD